jgi:hypothetical protein
MLVGFRLRFLFCFANDDDRIDAVCHCAAERFHAIFHQSDLVLDARQALLIIGAVLVAIHEPGLALLRNDVHAFICTARRVESGARTEPVGIFTPSIL